MCLRIGKVQMATSDISDGATIDGTPTQSDQSEDKATRSQSKSAGDDLIPRSEAQKLIDDAISKRIGRLESKHKKGLTDAVNAFRTEHGLDDTALEQFSNWRSETEKTTSDLSKTQMENSALKKRLDASETAYQAMVKRADDEKLERFIQQQAMTANALPKALPQIIAQLQQAYTIVDGKVFVRGADGEIDYSQEPETHFSSYMGDNTHLVRASAPTGGSGSRGGTVTPALSGDYVDTSDRSAVQDVYNHVMSKQSS